jgi:hypothetical protein
VNLQVERVLYYQLSRSLWVVKQTPLGAVTASNLSFAKDSRKLSVSACRCLNDLLCRASEVTISLKNQGEEAYKPKEYGKSIVITRKFTKEGNSSWKIKSKDGRIISTKKDELAAICDHMNIQVDNPMNVLTQGV